MAAAVAVIINVAAEVATLEVVVVSVEDREVLLKQLLKYMDMKVTLLSTKMFHIPHMLNRV